jgi:hypothetical protein
MKAVHLLNAFAWGANAVVWALYAHVYVMAVMSLLVAGVAVYIARMDA